MVSKYDFRDLVINENWIEVDIYMESMRKEGDRWDWYNEIVSDLELDAYVSFDEYLLNESIKDWIYKYIFD